jgi:nitrogen-specific signal transduction histidine kinase
MYSASANLAGAVREPCDNQPCDASEAFRRVAHELRQPLSAIETTAFYLEMVLPQGELRARQQAAKLQEFVEHANTILTDATHLLIDATPRLALIDLDELIADCIAGLGASEASLVHVRCGSELPLALLDRAMGGHMVRNLLQIALCLTVPGSAVTVSATSGAADVELEICCPVPASLDPSALLDPFCTLLPHRSGLALHAARRLAEAHRGQFELSAEEGMIQFFVSLPRA